MLHELRPSHVAHAVTSRAVTTSPNWSSFRGFAAGESERRIIWTWFALALLYAVACCVMALHQALASKYLFADDAREHVFWMARYLNPALFPHDPSADYFQALAPSGYATLYWLLARVGIAPLLASKFIPSVLSLFAAGYFFRLTLRLFRSPAAAALGTILLSQCLWCNSDLPSATPRAFFYPLFIAFLYYQVRGSTAGVMITIALEALFFPPAALLSLGVLAWDNLDWEKGRGPIFVREPRPYLLLIGASALSLLCLLPYLHRVGSLGPLVTFAEARRMPEFGPHGRVPYFLPTWWGRWVGGNGGIHNIPSRPPWLLAAFLWPVLRRFPHRFPVLDQVPRGVRPAWQVIAAALSLFFAAHLLFFHLYLPNRYTESVMRVVLVLFAAGVLYALIDAAARWAAQNYSRFELVAPAILFGLLAAYPMFARHFPSAGYSKGSDPALYAFFARQPPDIHIASLADEADNLPILCQRSIIIGAECAVPFHPDYYLPLRERGLQIARAQYSADLPVLQKCLRDQQIDFWLLDRAAFARKYARKSRLLRQLQLSAPNEALGPTRGVIPFLQQPPPESIVYADSRFQVIAARSLLALRPDQGAVVPRSHESEQDLQFRLRPDN